MEYQYILTKSEDGIFQIILNRPDKLNALNFRMVEEIHHALTLPDLEKTKALFILGNEKAFCAGGDLKEMKSLHQSEAERRSQFIHNTFQKFQQLPFPTIAFISGICMGGGLEIALHCDFRFCNTNSRLALPELQYGMIPGAGGTVQLPKQFGNANSAYYLYTGADIPLELALHSGLVQKIIQTEQFSESLETLANHFRSLHIEVIKALKELLLANHHNIPIEKRYMLEAAHFSSLLSTFGKEGIGEKF